LEIVSTDPPNIEKEIVSQLARLGVDMAVLAGKDKEPSDQDG